MAEEPHGTPPPGGWLPPEAAPQQPPQYPQYQQQPQYGWGQQQSPWASTYYYTYAEPDNSPALGGFITSLASIGALVFFLGLLSPLTLIASIVATFVSRNGSQKVERGETTKHADLAKWGFWLGILGVVLSVLAMAAWLALILAAPEVFDDTTTEPR
jgi:hypothetical protein